MPRIPVLSPPWRSLAARPDAQTRDLCAYIRSLRSPDPKARLPDVPPCFLRLC